MAKQNKKKKGAPKKKQLQSNFPTKKETVEVKDGVTCRKIRTNPCKCY